MKAFLVFILVNIYCGLAFAAMHKEEVLYKDGDTQLKGYVFWDDAFSGERPAVLVFHEWWGLNDYALLRAEMMAESGYVAFAADMYGDSRITRHAKDAQGWMQQITAEISTWQNRAQLGYEQLLNHEKVDKTKTAGIGYCFGGATVMQLAYSGSDISGVISVHGSMPPATEQQARNIKSRVLILHGAKDEFVPAERIQKFTSALSNANVDWEMDIYSGAKHAFSNPYADGYGIKGIEYNESAEQRSWARTKSFLDDLFAVE